MIFVLVIVSYWLACGWPRIVGFICTLSVVWCWYFEDSSLVYLWLTVSILEMRSCNWHGFSWFNNGCLPIHFWFACGLLLFPCDAGHEKPHDHVTGSRKKFLAVLWKYPKLVIRWQLLATFGANHVKIIPNCSGQPLPGSLAGILQEYCKRILQSFFWGSKIFAISLYFRSVSVLNTTTNLASFIFCAWDFDVIPPDRRNTKTAAQVLFSFYVICDLCCIFFVSPFVYRDSNV